LQTSRIQHCGLTELTSFLTARRSLHKTSIILSAFERQQREISYYALDISRGELTDGLDKLVAVFGGSQYVKLRGLLGSYEDGVGWLAGYATSDMPKTVTFLWVGNSIANLTQSEAGSLLAEFVGACQNLRINCQFIISMDACQDEDKILAGYHIDGPMSPFILNGLQHANHILGDEVFRHDDWKCARDFDTTDRSLRVYYEAVRDADVHVDGSDFAFRKGDRITAITSGKWTEDDVHMMCVEAALEVVHVWPSAEKDYG
jgi:EasF-like predicted methyltransferase